MKESETPGSLVPKLARDVLDFAVQPLREAQHIPAHLAGYSERAARVHAPRFWGSGAGFGQRVPRKVAASDEIAGPQPPEDRHKVGRELRHHLGRVLRATAA